MQNAREILLQILSGGSLADKRVSLPFSELSWDFNPAEVVLPAEPGRDGDLRLRDETLSESRGFPKKKELERDLSQRGRLLHFFANHELLAIETMALALLKFPQAPEEFRKGLWKTLQDEQRHLGLYLQRMEEFGVKFGEVPLNLYFWNVLKNMQSPLDFVARMSLTFEQANLDFALEYAEMFEREIDDPKTAALLRQVHDDEVKHVAHGMKWFEAWRKHEASQWKEYEALLPFPLTPRRARGLEFFAMKSRLDAGLDSDFAEHVRVAGGSRGRIPRYFHFNPQDEWETGGRTLSTAATEKMQELAPVMLWLAKESDVVELPHEPPLSFLKQAHDLKGELPEFVLPGASLSRFHSFERLEPWMWGKSARKKEQVLQPKLKKSGSPFQDSWLQKTYWKEKTGSAGTVIRTEVEFTKWREGVDSGSFLFKSAISASGRGHQKWDLALASPEEMEKDAKRRIASEAGFVIEPFYSKRADFSIQYQIQDDGGIQEFAPRIFFNDLRLQYRGAWLGEPKEAFSEEWALIQNQLPLLRGVHTQLLNQLSAAGYRGPVGIDAMIAAGEQGLEIVPVIEVNVRYTMGRVAQSLEALIRKKGFTQGLWMFFSPQDLKKHGVGCFAELKVKLEHESLTLYSTTPIESQSTWTAVVCTPRINELLAII